MSHEVVVGVDWQSHSSRLAVQWAARHAWARRYELVLVHAIGAAAPVITHAWDGAIRAGVHTMLEREADELHAAFPDLKVRTQVDVDTPARCLTRHSATAALVVVGARHVGPGETMRARSRAYQVVSGAQCSVAVVPQAREPGGSQVVVGVDGSPDSLAAVRAAAREADLVGGELVVLHAWSEPVLFGHMAWAPPDFRAAVLDEAARVLAEASAGLATDFPDLRIERRLVESPPSPALLATAADAQLLVVGSRGLNGVARVLLGSTSHDVVLRAPCPVLVVRP